jgi:hypothetical protein
MLYTWDSCMPVVTARARRGPAVPDAMTSYMLNRFSSVDCRLTHVKPFVCTEGGDQDSRPHLSYRKAIKQLFQLELITAKVGR